MADPVPPGFGPGGAVFPPNYPPPGVPPEGVPADYIPATPGFNPLPTPSTPPPSLPPLIDNPMLPGAPAGPGPPEVPQYPGLPPVFLPSPGFGLPEPRSSPPKRRRRTDEEIRKLSRRLHEYGFVCGTDTECEEIFDFEIIGREGFAPPRLA